MQGLLALLRLIYEGYSAKLCILLKINLDMTRTI